MDATLAKRREKNDTSLSSLVKEIVIHVVYFLLGLLISKGAVFGSLAPFGVSLVAAVPLRYIGGAVGGASLGHILLSPEDSFRYIACIIAASALRWLFSDVKAISHSRLFPVIISFTPLFITGVVLSFVSEEAASILGRGFVEALLSAVGGYFLGRTVSLVGSLKGLWGFSKPELSCLGVSATIVMMSLVPVSLFGISLGRFLAVLLILMCAAYAGVSLSSVVAIATGVVFSTASPSMAFLGGSYALGGLAAGVLSAFGKLPAGVGFTLCSVVMSFSSGDNKLILILFAEALLATGVFMLIPSEFGNFLRTAFLPAVRTDREASLRANVVARLQHASKALGGVTSCVNEVSKKLSKTDDKSEFAVFKNAAEKTCKNCGLRVYCWEKQKEVTKDDLRRLRKELYASGYVTEKDIEDKFSKKCCKPKELATSICESYREYLYNISAKKRITQLRSVVAGEFLGIEKLLFDLSEEFGDSEEFDEKSAQLIVEELRASGYVAINCCCRLKKSGRMIVELIMHKSSRREIDLKEIHRTVSYVCGRRFERPSESLEEDRYRVVMSELSVYDVDIGSSQHISGGGDLCGDSFDYFLKGDGTVVTLISDGMGTGGAAAVDATMSVNIMKRLLKAGISQDCALSVVNSSLMVKSSDESTATLDALEVNLFTGKVSLFKAGAPLTFIKRGGRILRREAPSLPVGILPEARFSKDELTLREGDAILMISDGMLTGDDKWIEELLINWKDASARDVAAIAVNEAVNRRKDGHDDDITAVAIKLLKN